MTTTFNPSTITTFNDLVFQNIAFEHSPHGHWLVGGRNDKLNLDVSVEWDGEAGYYVHTGSKSLTALEARTYAQYIDAAAQFAGKLNGF